MQAQIAILLFVCVVSDVDRVFGCSSCPLVVFRASKVKAEDVTGIIKFEKADLNEYGGYNPSTGKFTAPSSGTYVFTWTLVTKERVAVGSQLVVNGETMVKAFSDARDATKWMDDSGSNTVPVVMKEGEEAYISIIPSWGKYVDGNGWSSFSGWKLGC